VKSGRCITCWREGKSSAGGAQSTVVKFFLLKKLTTAPIKKGNNQTARSNSGTPRSRVKDCNAAAKLTGTERMSEQGGGLGFLARGGWECHFSFTFIRKRRGGGDKTEERCEGVEKRDAD